MPFRPDNWLCYFGTSIALDSVELWLSLWACLDKFRGPLKVALVRHINTKNAKIVFMLLKLSNCA